MNHDKFLGKSGRPDKSLFLADGLHPSHKGIKILTDLLVNLQTFCNFGKLSLSPSHCLVGKETELPKPPSSTATAGKFQAPQERSTARLLFVENRPPSLTDRDHFPPLVSGNESSQVTLNCCRDYRGALLAPVIQTAPAPALLVTMSPRQTEKQGPKSKVHVWESSEISSPAPVLPDKPIRRKNHVLKTKRCEVYDPSCVKFTRKTVTSKGKIRRSCNAIHITFPKFPNVKAESETRVNGGDKFTRKSPQRRMVAQRTMACSPSFPKKKSAVIPNTDILSHNNRTRKVHHEQRGGGIKNPFIDDEAEHSSSGDEVDRSQRSSSASSSMNGFIDDSPIPTEQEPFFDFKDPIRAGILLAKKLKTSGEKCDFRFPDIVEQTSLNPENEGITQSSSNNGEQLSSSKSIKSSKFSSKSSSRSKSSSNSSKSSRKSKFKNASKVPYSESEKSRKKKFYLTRKFDPEFKAKEAARKSAFRTSSQLSDPDFKKKEAARKAASRNSSQLSDPEFKAKEAARKSAFRTSSQLSDPDFKKKEAARKAASRNSSQLSDPDFKAKEAARKAVYRKQIKLESIKRLDWKFIADIVSQLVSVATEKSIDSSEDNPMLKQPDHLELKCKHGSTKSKPCDSTGFTKQQVPLATPRLDDDPDNPGNSSNLTKYNLTTVKEFRKMMAEYPTYMCHNCNKLFFRNGVVKDKTIEPKSDKDITVWICSKCKRYRNSNKICPSSTREMLLDTGELPPHLHTNSTETRLVSMRIQFMKIRSLPSGGQRGLKGAVVNVPIDAQETCLKLPRCLPELGIFHVRIKRHIKHRSVVLADVVDPHKITTLLQWFKRNNPLYQFTVLNNDWINENYHENQDFFNTHFMENSVVVASSIVNELIANVCNEGTYDELPYDHCIQPKDPLQNFPHEVPIMDYAPGQGNTPIPVLGDPLAEPVLP